MSEVVRAEGQCLCGAVRIVFEAPIADLSACHCSLCRRWGGAAFWGFSVDPADATVTGEVARYRSSPFAERAWCPACGTHLWLRDDDGPYEFLPGLFEAARDVALTHEVYADQAFACARLAGDHPRITRAEYEKTNPFVEGDAP